MPLSFVRDDVTHLAVDAIVNAANPQLLPGGGVCGAIFAAAGRELVSACSALAPCETGQSVITPGFHLRAKHVIHTVGPIWRGGRFGEEALLRSCYRTALALAEQSGLASVAFPLISAGIYGYPPEQALAVAVSEISAYLAHSDLDVTLVFFDSRLTALGLDHDPELRQFIDDNYVEQSPFLRRREAELQRDMLFAVETEAPAPRAAAQAERNSAPEACADAPAMPDVSLEEMLSRVGETFSHMLLRMIDERGWKDSDAYHRANIDRKLFSKIRNSPRYHPKKETALAFAVALELSPEEADALLAAAGYAMSRADRRDLIVRYYLSHREYDIHRINLKLFSFHEEPLGC